MRACSWSAPLELVQLMITKARLDTRKRCLLAIVSHIGRTVLHWAFELLIREHPLALCATDGNTPHRLQPTAIISLLTDTTNALAAGYYATSTATSVPSTASPSLPTASLFARLSCSASSTATSTLQE